MDVLTAARAQMELSLAFHMIFAAFGIGLPILMVMAEGLWIRTKKEHYLELARQWSKATALLFAIGAVSGTALSFELGLLWPRFMEFAGGIIGPAFALEGYAFFIEAIFLGLYLYGWDRLSPKTHWICGAVVAVSGLASGVIVVSANAWMQAPVGFELVDGRPVNVDPIRAIVNPAWIRMAVHSTLSCTIAVGFAVAGVYAVGMLRGRRDEYHRSGLALALTLGALTAVVQPISGHYLGQQTARIQPAKLAAMERHYETQAEAPLRIAGLLEIPGGLSLVATGDSKGVVKGLNDFPPEDRPNVLLTHVSFQVMVACGMLLIAVGAWFAWARWRKRVDAPWFLRSVAAASPLGFVALEAGWLVTEAGRQPWTIYGIMRTREAVTPSPDVWFSFVGFSLLYFGLALALVALLRRLASRAS